MNISSHLFLALACYPFQHSRERYTAVPTLLELRLLPALSRKSPGSLHRRGLHRDKIAIERVRVKVDTQAFT